ncbi:hypothetical protein L1887_38780 [Cichorium endivia]|nr:hypothetical protein L1887_38780 [Cichorium endivia]
MRLSIGGARMLHRSTNATPLYRRRLSDCLPYLPPTPPTSQVASTSAPPNPPVGAVDRPISFPERPDCRKTESKSKREAPSEIETQTSTMGIDNGVKVHLKSIMFSGKLQLKSSFLNGVKVSDLLGKHAENAVLERCENIDGFLAGVMDKKEKERENRREINTAKEDMYKEKYWGKSIQELDLSNHQRCTPSYRLLPDDVVLNTYLSIFPNNDK